MSADPQSAPIDSQLLDTQISDARQDLQDLDVNVSAGEPQQDAGQGTSEPAKKRERKEPVALVHEPGKSILPFSRVQKIIKADKDIPIVAKEATFLISLATEEFIKRITEASQRVARRENRATVQHRDLATVVRKVDEFLFLEEIIPWLSPDAPAKRSKPLKGSAETAEAPTGPTLLDQFVKKSTTDSREDDAQELEEDGDDEEEDVGDGDGDVIMNEDGTMVGGDTER